MAAGSRFARSVPVAGVAVLLCLHLFFITPVTIHAGNADQFTTSLPDLLLTYVRPALFLVLALTLAASLLPASVASRCSLVLGALCLMLWVQGHLLVWDYGQLDGRPIDWSGDSWRGWLDGALWLAAIAFGFLAAGRAARVLLILATVSTLLLVAVSAVRMLQTPIRSAGLEASVSSHQMHRFSTTRNVLHIVADGVQTDVFRELLEQGSGKGISRDSLDGFVFYPQHLGAFPYTHMSVPAILSGRMYDNSVARERFLDQALGPRSASLLNAAAANGFTIDLAIASGIERLYTRGAFHNLHPLVAHGSTDVGSFRTREAATLIDLVLFRVAPHALKRGVYRDQQWLVQGWISAPGEVPLPSFAHAEFVRAVAEHAVADRVEPVYKLMHLMVSHEPMATADDCSFAGRLLPTERAAVLAQTRCGLEAILALFERMKRLGIYDSTTIVLMADHGAWLAPSGHVPAERAQGGPTVLPKTVGLAMPLFAIKAPGASGPLRESEAPSWIVDTPATVAATAGIEGEFPGRNALELAPGEQRSRLFRAYKFERGEWQASFLAPMQESRVSGPPVYGQNWQLIRVLQPGSVSPETEMP